MTRTDDPDTSPEAVEEVAVAAEMAGYTPIAALLRQLAKEKAEAFARNGVLEEAGCPRPANSRPDNWSIRQCNDAEECGCVFGRALITPKQDEPTGAAK